MILYNETKSKSLEYHENSLHEIIGHLIEKNTYPIESRSHLLVGDIAFYIDCEPLFIRFFIFSIAELFFRKL